MVNIYTLGLFIKSHVKLREGGDKGSYKSVKYYQYYQFMYTVQLVFKTYC